MSESNSASSTAVWIEITRLCRRVCVLREQGCHEDAENLRVRTLTPLVSSLQRDPASAADVAARLDTILAAETERVATAAAVAELLVPLLQTARAEAGDRVTVDALRPIASPPPRPAALPDRGPATPAAPAAASIADFLDEMLAQETPPVAPAGASRRRAS